MVDTTGGRYYWPSMEGILNKVADNGMHRPPSGEFVKNPSWWRIRSRKRCLALISVSVLTSLASIVLLILCRSTPGHKKDLCLTAECIATAKYLLKGMNLSVDPCEDFYRYTCAKAEKQFIPEDKTSVDLALDVGDLISNYAATMLTEPMRDEDSKPLKLAKTYYGLCMDKQTTEEMGLKVLFKIMNATGGWPVIAGVSWSGAAWSWTNTTYKFREVGFGVDSIFETYVQADTKNSRHNIAIGAPVLVPPYKDNIVYRQLSPKQDRAVYLKYMVGILKLLGAPPDLAEKEMEQVLDFEAELDLQSNEPPADNVVTIEDLIQRYPTIPWLEYINNMLLWPKPVDEKERIVLKAPKYIGELERIMTKTPKRVLANYLWWKEMDTIIPYLPQKYEELLFQFEDSTLGATKLPNRKKSCIADIKESLTEAVTSEYIKRYVAKDLKENVTILVNGIKAELRMALLNISWMGNSIRKNAVDKCDEMKPLVAYPDELVDDQIMESFYKELEIHSNITYLEAKLKTTKFTKSFEFRKLKDKFLAWSWYRNSRVLNVDSFYRLNENEFSINVGILQGHFYSSTRPNYLNYAATGWVIGHEITHGFDGNPVEYDGKQDWWDLATREEFIKKAKCFIDQYSGFVAGSVNKSIDGNLTLAENIADNGGIKFAYKAYQKWITANKVEQILPGFENYNPSQIFWITAANTWCTAYRPDQLSDYIQTNGHAPAEFRVIGSFQNSQEFARDFNCPVGSPMNPTKKCVIW